MTRVRTAAELALDRRLSGYAVAFLTVLALWLLLAPLAPAWTGYGALERWLGEAAIARCAAAFLFLYFAGIVREKNELRHTLDGLVHAVNQQLYGADYRQARATVETLIAGLRSSREDIREKAARGLQKLTGEDFGSDAGRWEAWWAERGTHYGRPARGGEGGGEPS